MFFIETLDKMSYANSFYLVGHGNPNMRYFDSIRDVKCKEKARLTKNLKVEGNRPFLEARAD